jgi:hypothetical protein
MSLLRRLVAPVAVVLVIVAAGTSVLYHEEASGWPWSGPQWLHLCGRDYEKEGPPETLARLEQQAERHLHLYPAYVVLPVLGPEVYADTAPTDRAHAPGEPCSGALYTRSGSDYQIFTLSGGV